MSLTYADVPLLLEDPGHQLQHWLDRSLSLEDLRLFGAEPVSLREGRQRPRNSAYTVGLGTPNSTAPPRLKINTLWIPTGASRWSMGLFLCGGDALATITTNLSDTSGALLKVAEPRTVGPTTSWKELEYSMYLLPPRRLAHAGGEEALWLLPLVDLRYFWQWRDFGYQALDEETTWQSLIDYLGIALNTGIAYDPIPYAYQKPDAIELSRHHENAAVLVDAVAACVGMRAVFDPRLEQLTLENAASAAAKYAASLNLNGEILAGGSAATLLGRVPNYKPDAVKVVFPIYRESRIDPDVDVYSITKSAELYTTATMPTGTTKVFYDSCNAEMTGVDTGDSPHNADLLSDLANQIAADYYAWLALVYDGSYIGIGSWYLSGFDDYIWYHLGWQRPTASGMDQAGDYASFTRIASQPYNFGVSELLHWPLPESSQSAGSSSQSSGTGDAVRVVTDICCDGEDIVICYSDLIFDVRGHFIHVNKDVGGCDCD